MAGLRTQKTRRKQAKTDYKLRLNLLKSGIPRIVIRRTNRYLIVQLVESNEAKDKTISIITSKDLLKQGFDRKFSGSLKSIPAGYLTGVFFAKRLKDKEKEYIIDLGLSRKISGNRLYSVLKGLVDGGAKISVNEKIFPSKQRIDGEHLKEDVKKALNKLKEKILI